MSDIPPGPFQQPQDPQPSIRDRVLDIVRRQQEQQERAMLDTFELAVKSDPERRAEAQRVARDIGIDPDTVERNLDVMRGVQQRRAMQLRNLSLLNPALAARMNDIEFARVSHDLVDDLSFTESLSRNYQIGQLQVERGRLYQRVKRGQASEADFAQLQRVNQWLDSNPEQRGWTTSFATVLGQMSITAPKIIESGLGTALTAAAVTAAAGQAGPQAATPEEIVTVPVSLATGFGIGATARLIFEAGETEAGNAYGDYIRAGMTPFRASVASSGVGLVNGALEAAGVGFMAAPVKRAVASIVRERVSDALVRPTVSRAALEFAKSWATSVGGEVGTEVAQEVSNIVGEYAAGGSPEGIAERLAETAIATTQAMALLAVPGPALNLRTDVRRALAADQQRAFFENLTKNPGVQTMRDRAPDQLKRFVDQALDGSSAETIYVDAARLREVLAQGELSQDAAKAIPDLDEQLRRAEATGGDVEIKTSDFAANIAGTRLGDAIVPHMRIDPDGMSEVEAEQFRAAQPELVQQAKEAIDRLGTDAESIVAELDTIEQDYAAQILATGTTDASTANAQAKFLRDFITVTATKAGMTPAQFRAKYPLQVRRAEVAEGALAQSGRGGFDPNSFTMMLLRGEDATRGSDRTTFLHESAHFFLSVYEDLAAQAESPAFVQQDMAELLRWFGVESLEQWRALAPEQRRTHHETFAYNFEDFLSSGKSPSLERTTLYRRFASWLRRAYVTVRDELNRIYRNETGQDLPALTPEVRGVMERMLASEEAIAQATAVRRMVPVFQTREQFPGTDAQWAEYEAASQAAVDEAVDQLQQRSISAMRWLEGARGRALKAIQAQEKEARAKVREEVAVEVAAQRVHRLRHWLAKGEFIGEDGLRTQDERDTDHKLRTEAVQGMAPGGTDTAPLNRYMRKDGLHPDAVAARFGYENGAQMVRELLAAPSLKDAITQRTDERMMREYSELVDERAVQQAINEAVHNEARARFVALELKHAAKMGRPSRLTLAAAKEAARLALESTPVRQITYARFSRIESKAARDAEQAMIKGDAAEVMRAKQRQLLANQMARQALKLEREVEKMVRGTAKFFESDEKIGRQRNIDFVSVARAVLASFSLGRGSELPLQFLEQMREYNRPLFEKLGPIVLATNNGNSLQDYRNLTLEQFREVIDTAEALWDTAKRDRNITVEGQQVAKEQALAELTEQARKMLKPRTRTSIDTTQKDRQAFDLGNAKAWLTRVEHWTKGMDEGQDGPFTRYIFRPLRKAYDTYISRKEVYVKRIRDYVQALQVREGSIDATPELGEGATFTSKWALLGAMLHTGNESNLRKLLLGYGWAQEVEGVVDTRKWDAFVDRMVEEGTLTKADFDFLQAVWDLNEEVKPDAWQAHLEMFRFRPAEVQAQAFTNSFGTYRGGYVPATPDFLRAENVDVQLRDGIQGLADMEGLVTKSFPDTGKGFTKGRTGATRPLDLDVRRIISHVDQVLRFTYLQPRVRDVLQLVNDRRFALVLNQADQGIIRDMLLPWLDRTARNRTMTPSGNNLADQLFTFLSSSAGATIMFFNVVNAAQQITGFSNSNVYVRARHLRAGFLQFLLHPFKTSAMVTERSEFMRNRIGSQIGQLMDDIQQTLEPGFWSSLSQSVQRKTYILQSWFQQPVDTITWLGAYRQRLEEMGADQTDAKAVQAAVDFADGVVRQSQASTTAPDVARYQAGTPASRFWFQFTGYLNNALNQIMQQRDVPAKVRATLLVVTIPAIASALIQAALSGDLNDDEGDGFGDEFAEWFMFSQLKAAAGLVPGGSLGASLVSSQGDRMAMAPGMQAIQSLVRGSFAVYDRASGEKDALSGRDVRDIWTAFSMLSGMPLGVVGRTLGYVTDVESGRVTPTGPGDFARGLVTGRASQASR